MASIEIEIDLGPMVRDAMIKGLADVVTCSPQFTGAVVLEVLRRNDVLRTMIAEEIGERGIKEHKADEEAARIYDANKGEGCEPPAEKSWDDISKEALAALLDTPMGRGEAR